MNQAQALYRLQSLEHALDEATQRLNEIEAALQNDEILQQARAALKARSDEQHSAEVNVTTLDLELNSLITKMSEGEELLYSGKINNPKELSERQAEYDSLKRRQAKLEEDLSAARQQLEVARAAVSAAQRELEQIEQEQAQAHQDLLKERSTLQPQMKGWLRDRKLLLEQIDPVNHKIYKRLKAQKNGIAVARLDNETCSVCRVEQTELIVRQVRQAKELVYCHDCARILVAL